MDHATPRLRWRGKLIPAEHGAWGLFLEALVLGLLLAPSGPGALVALAAVSLFFCRTALLRWWLGRRAATAVPVRRAVAAWGFFWLILAGAAFLAALRGGGHARFLLPLGLAAPLAASQWRAQLGRGAREVRAELAGTLALSAFTPAIVLAGGWSLASAALLWTLPALRGVLSVDYVRAKLRLQRGDEALVGKSLLVHLLAAAAMAPLTLFAHLPPLAAAAFGLLLLRALWGLSRRRPPVPARRVGLVESAMGIIFVAMVVVGYRFPVHAFF